MLSTAALLLPENENALNAGALTKKIGQIIGDLSDVM